MQHFQNSSPQIPALVIDVTSHWAVNRVTKSLQDFDVCFSLKILNDVVISLSSFVLIVMAKNQNVEHCKTLWNHSIVCLLCVQTSKSPGLGPYAHGPVKLPVEIAYLFVEDTMLVLFKRLQFWQSWNIHHWRERPGAIPTVQLLWKVRK